MLKKIASNWKSGLTIALVSIPLSISLAVASQVSPTQGIITAIWAGLFASLLGGSNYNIIGPTGALSGVIAAFVLLHGVAYVSTLALVAGCIILCGYALHIERYLVLIPSSVIHGFTLGVACIIGFNQLNAALGLKNVVVHEQLYQNILETFKQSAHFSPTAIIVFVLFFVALIILKKMTSVVPNIMVLSPLGIALGYMSEHGMMPYALETLATKYGAFSLQLVQMPTSIFFSYAVVSTSFVIALIAILETMLSAKIADGATKTRHNSRKEIFGLGVANIVSGLVGGIPATAALARTALNIKAGATNKVSATLSSIFLIGIAFVCMPWFRYMPMAVIAAILVNVAVNMIEAEHFEKLFKLDKRNFFISLLVAFMTVYKDPIIGILIGAVFSLLLFVEKLSHGFYEVTFKGMEEAPFGTANENNVLSDKQTIVYSFKGSLSYISSQAHVIRFEHDFQAFHNIILRFNEVSFVDIDGGESVDIIIEDLQKNKKDVFIVCSNANMRTLLAKFSKKYKQLDHQGHVFMKTQQAVERLEKQS